MATAQKITQLTAILAQLAQTLADHETEPRTAPGTGYARARDADG